MNMRLLSDPDAGPLAALPSSSSWVEFVTLGPDSYAYKERILCHGDDEEAQAGDLVMKLLDAHGQAKNTTLYFAYWDGFGLASSVAKTINSMNCERRYFIFDGTVDEIGLFDFTNGLSVRDELAIGPPSFIWPAAMEWLVVKDVDADYFGICSSLPLSWLPGCKGS